MSIAYHTCIIPTVGPEYVPYKYHTSAKHMPAPYKRHTSVRNTRVIQVLYKGASHDLQMTYTCRTNVTHTHTFGTIAEQVPYMSHECVILV